MSKENPIRLENLIIGSINKNTIRIELAAQSQITQDKIYQTFEKIRWEYFDGMDQLDDLYLPLRFKRDKYSGERLHKGDYLLLSNKKKSKYFDHYCQNITFETLVTELSQHLTICINVDLKLTYLRHFDKLFVKANVGNAVINFMTREPPISVSHFILIDDPEVMESNDSEVMESNHSIKLTTI